MALGQVHTGEEKKDLTAILQVKSKLSTEVFESYAGIDFGRPLRYPELMLTSKLLNSVIAAFPLLLLAFPPAFAQSGQDTAVFTEVYPSLEEAMKLLEEQRELPESSYFRKDKKNKQEDINELLDEAVSKLEFPDITRYRRDINDARKSILLSRTNISQYRRAILSAPEEATLGMDNVPLFVSKKGYAKKIELEEQSIARGQEIIKTTSVEFLSRLQALGIHLEREQFDVLLNTVNGEDFLQLTVAFEAVKGVTTQLQQLTRESGEDIQTARKYYGMYTVLLRILDHLQRKFIDDIVIVHLPKLAEFETSAQRNIDQATETLSEGGDRSILERNIEANKLTLEAMGLYRRYLLKQRADVEDSNGELQRQIKVAENTYNTVSLASEVVRLLQTGMKSFEAIERLAPPELAEFKNQVLRDELSKLTELMKQKP